MNPYGTFPFNETNGIGHTKFWRYTHTNMNMILHSMPFEQFQTLLPTKVSNDLSYFPFYFSIQV